MAAILFTGGCNFRCPYCHNGELVLHPNDYPVYTDEEIFGYLKARHKMLDGVVVSGGEPAIQPDIEDYIARLKALGYLVKLDTNGTRPDVLKRLVENRLIDYVAMDIKNCPERYAATVGCPHCPVDKVAESVKYLLADHIDYEFRTTVTDETHTMEDFISIASFIKGAKRYYLQNFVANENTITKECHSVPHDKLEGYCRKLNELGIPTEIRND